MSSSVRGNKLHTSHVTSQLSLTVCPCSCQKTIEQIPVFWAVFDAVSLITRLKVELPYNEIDFAQLFLFRDLLNQPSLGYFCSTNSSSGPVAHKLNHTLSESGHYLSAQNDATLKTTGIFLRYEEQKFVGTGIGSGMLRNMKQSQRNYFSLGS